MINFEPTFTTDESVKREIQETFYSIAPEITSFDGVTIKVNWIEYRSLVGGGRYASLLNEYSEELRNYDYFTELVAQSGVNEWQSDGLNGKHFQSLMNRIRYTLDKFRQYQPNRKGNTNQWNIFYYEEVMT